MNHDWRALILLLACSALPAAEPSETWIFDRLDSLGGHPTKVLGHPRIIDSPVGKAMEFDGVEDAVFVEAHPLAGAETFTWEVVFRPDHDGRPEQRFFHLSERDPATGKDTQTRLLFETRIVEGRWYLDSFAYAGGASGTLMNRQKLHPADTWYHAAMVYDGKQFRNYVNGEMEGSRDVHLIPQGQGHSSAGVRINLVDHFKGAIRMARFTRRPLAVSEFALLR